MKKIQCTNCNSYKTFNPRKTYLVGGIVVAVLSIPWIFIVIGIFTFLAGVVIAIKGLTMQSKLMECRQCKNQWEPLEQPVKGYEPNPIEG